MSNESLPKSARDFAASYPRIWKAYAELGKELSEAGPLDGKNKRLVKLALAIGSGSEGAVHSHTRQALSDGISAEEIKHTALLAVTTLGLPNAFAALSWIEDITDSTQ